MWITKTVFVGSDGNKTIETNESTTKDWAELKKTKQIERWYGILVDGTNSSSPEKIPQGLYNIGSDIKIFSIIQLNMILFTIDMKNNYCKPNVKNSFSVVVYELNDN